MDYFPLVGGRRHVALTPHTSSLFALFPGTVCERRTGGCSREWGKGDVFGIGGRWTRKHPQREWTHGDPSGEAGDGWR